MKVFGARAAWATRRAERLRCVVVESGSPLLAEAGSAEFDETIVIAQTQGEAPAALAQRFADRLTSLEHTGRHLQSVVVLVGRRHDAEARAARRRVIGLLSSHARAHGALSQLTLLTARDSDAEQQAELFGLAEAVTTLPNAELVPVRVRFGQSSGPEPRQVA